MRKGLLIIFALLLCSFIAESQNGDGTRLPARANVVPYDDEDAIVKGEYRESPYYMELTGRWDQRQTDSSRSYTREIEVEKYWKDYCVTLNVRGSYACRVFLNGKLVGYGDDSRHWNEFALDGFLKYGKTNELRIDFLKHPEGALLECESGEVGLNGEPYLLFKSDPNIADMTLVGDYDAASATGSLAVDATIFSSKRKGRYYLEVEIWDPQNHSFDRMGRWVVFDGKSEMLVDMSRSWPNVAPWTAETPNLYTAVLRLRDEEMEVEEVVGARFGFRRVEVKDGLLKINGTTVTLKGVNIADNSTGEYNSRQMLRSLMQNLKDNNINAVRTSRFSPTIPCFYELCDEYGLYVICDANLMPASSQRQAVATDKNFIPLFERRVENLYGMYKNYTSIIAWSLGDTRDNGVCMGAAYKRLKTIEKNRPVIFSGAEFSSNTDIVAFINPDQQLLRQAVSKSGDRPFLVLAAHEEGFGKIWDKVVNTRTLQGAFVDEWPMRMLPEVKHLYSPFDVHLSKKTIDDAEFTVYNRNDFADFSQYLLDYTIYTNLRPSITGGDLPLAIRGGGVEVAKLRVPPVNLQAGEELFVRFDLSRRKKAGARLLSGTNNLGTVVFPLSDRSGEKKMLDLGNRKLLATFESLDGRERCRVHTLTNEVAFNLADGTMEWLTSGMGQLPIDSLSLFFENHRDWKCSLAAISHNQPSPGVYSVDAMLRYHSREGALMCDVRQTYTVFVTGDVVIDYIIAPTDQVHETLVPRVELLHTFGAGDTLSWFGLDRETPYGHSSSAIPGTYRQTLPHGMIRDDNRWCALADTAYKGLFIDVPDTHFTFMADTGKLWITPCISTPMKPSFRLHLRGFSPKRFNISSVFVNMEDYVKQTQGGERVEDFVGITYPRVATGMLEPPVITVTEARFSAPMTVTISSHQSDRQLNSQTIIRYTLDGSEPDENSPIYKGPITLTTTTMVKARAFGKEMPPSFTAMRKFNYDYIVSTIFSRKPNTPFNVGTDTILFDGEKGLVSDLQRGWLGFSGSGVEATVMLAKQVDIEYLTLRFAHVPDNWAFAPEQVSVLLSADGEHYTDTLQVSMPFNPAASEENNSREVEVKVPVMKDGVASLKIVIRALDAVPSWHRAKGLKPWILMDEIEISERLNKQN